MKYPGFNFGEESFSRNVIWRFCKSKHHQHIFQIIVWRVRSLKYGYRITYNILYRKIAYIRLRFGSGFNCCTIGLDHTSSLKLWQEVGEESWSGSSGFQPFVESAFNKIRIWASWKQRKFKDHYHSSHCRAFTEVDAWRSLPYRVLLGIQKSPKENGPPRWHF